MSDQLDKKLEEIIANFANNTYLESEENGEIVDEEQYIKAIKQALVDDGWIHLSVSQETQAAIANTMLGHTVLTGQQWYDKFSRELYVPKPQDPIRTRNDDGESHDRFMRDGGANFMYHQAITAAKKASGIN